jgi:pyruvate decarboxylase
VSVQPFPSWPITLIHRGQEYVPVVHIVGTPSTLTQSSGLVMHHTLGNGNYNTFVDMSRDITCALVKLHDPAEIANQIDHAIRECWIKSRPAYVALPMDMVGAKIEGARLRHPIDLSFPRVDPEKEDYVVDVVLKYLHAAKNPVVLVDACAIRHHAAKETDDFLEKSGLPVFIAPMAKGGLDETRPTFCGVYAGNASLPEIGDRVESSDLVLSIGAIKSGEL